MRKTILTFLILSFSMFFNAKIPNTSKSLVKNIYLNISLHIEGTPYSQITNYQRYENHIESINKFIIPIEANNPSVKFNFELSHQFILQDIMHGETKFGQGNSFAKIMKSKGHAILIHADIGGQSESNSEYENKLQTIINKYELLMGIKPSGASGICGTNNWIETLKNNGIQFVTSMVEYCKKSIFKRNLTFNNWWVKSCISPGSTVPEGEISWDPSVNDCHGIFPNLSEYTIRPFILKDSRNWLKNISIYQKQNILKKFQNLVAFSSMHIGKLTCLSNSATEPNCVEDQMDIIEFENRLNDSYNIIKDSGYQNNYLNFVLSIGTTYTPSFSTSIGLSLKTFVTENNITWRNAQMNYSRLMLGL
jgi:hypothetical protein